MDPLSSNFTGGHGGDDDFDTFRDDFEKPMLFSDLIPNPRLYDKMRPPKIDNKPTKIGFHVTVMGLDSIDEYSMVQEFDQSIVFLYTKTTLIFSPIIGG